MCAEDRQGVPEGLVQQDLPRRVGDVVGAPHHVGDPHQGVVHHRRKVVDGRLAIVRAEDDEVVDLLRRHLDPALDQVVPDHGARPGHVKSDGGPAARHRAPLPAGTQVPHRLLGRPRRLAPRRQLLRQTRAGIGLPLGHQPLHLFSVQRLALELPVRPHRPTDLRPLVPVQRQPAQTVQDRADRVLGGALHIGVLDAQDERPTLRPGEEPVVQGGSHAADVQIPGGAGRKAHPNPPGGSRCHGGLQIGERPQSSPAACVMPPRRRAAYCVPMPQPGQAEVERAISDQRSAVSSRAPDGERRHAAGRRTRCPLRDFACVSHPTAHRMAAINPGPVVRASGPQTLRRDVDPGGAREASS